MNEIELLGYAVSVIITLAAFVNIVHKFTQPINELKIVIQKLNDTIESLKNDNANHNKRIERHGIEIDNLNNRVGKIETKIEMYHGEQ